MTVRWPRIFRYVPMERHIFHPVMRDVQLNYKGYNIIIFYVSENTTAGKNIQLFYFTQICNKNFRQYSFLFRSMDLTLSVFIQKHCFDHCGALTLKGSK